MWLNQLFSADLATFPKEIHNIKLQRSMKLFWEQFIPKGWYIELINTAYGYTFVLAENTWFLNCLCKKSSNTKENAFVTNLQVYSCLNYCGCGL